MSLKESGCLLPCTPCRAERNAPCTAAGSTEPIPEVFATVKLQLRSATMGTFWGAVPRIAEVEKKHSLNIVVPALAAWAGLGNGPRMLIRLPGLTASTYVRLLSQEWSLSRVCPLFAHSYCLNGHAWIHSGFVVLFGCVVLFGNCTNF